uniref:Uncharacterized protein n=1 Tax=Romanomermis culicivorax TaxID=13658 RepID=A0A915JZZ4_ROMCU
MTDGNLQPNRTERKFLFPSVTLCRLRSVPFRRKRQKLAPDVKIDIKFDSTYFCFVSTRAVRKHPNRQQRKAMADAAFTLHGADPVAKLNQIVPQKVDGYCEIGCISRAVKFDRQQQPWPCREE